MRVALYDPSKPRLCFTCEVDDELYQAVLSRLIAGLTGEREREFSDEAKLAFFELFDLDKVLLELENDVGHDEVIEVSVPTKVSDLVVLRDYFDDEGLDSPLEPK